MARRDARSAPLPDRDPSTVAEVAARLASHAAGRIPEAVIAAALIVTVNLALRPVARRIDRSPANEDTEVDTGYQFSVVCKEAKEAHIRALLTQSLSASDFVLHGLRSQDLDRPGLVEVQAELHLHGRDDLALEQAVNRISLEPSVSSVRWTVMEATGSGSAEL